MLEEPKWGIDVPSCRLWGYSPTFGSLILFFFRKSTTRSYYVMNFSQRSLRERKSGTFGNNIMSLSVSGRL
jgi:hypothetical protein